MDIGTHFDQGFSEGDTRNVEGHMIHPVTGNLVNFLNLRLNSSTF